MPGFLKASSAPSSARRLAAIFSRTTASEGAGPVTVTEPKVTVVIFVESADAGGFERTVFPFVEASSPMEICITTSGLSERSSPLSWLFCLPVSWLKLECSSVVRRQMITLARVGERSRYRFQVRINRSRSLRYRDSARTPLCKEFDESASYRDSRSNIRLAVRRLEASFWSFRFAGETGGRFLRRF